MVRERRDSTTDPGCWAAARGPALSSECGNCQQPPAIPAVTSQPQAKDHQDYGGDDRFPVAGQSENGGTGPGKGRDRQRDERLPELFILVPCLLCSLEVKPSCSASLEPLDGVHEPEPQDGDRCKEQPKGQGRGGGLYPPQGVRKCFWFSGQRFCLTPSDFPALGAGFRALPSRRLSTFAGRPAPGPGGRGSLQAPRAAEWV